MGYAEHLRTMLRPLGVYDLSETSLSGAELTAAGGGLDGASARLDAIYAEGLIPTAGEEGLSLYESLLSRRPAAPTLKRRRAALRALFGIREGDFSLADINRAIDGCGVLATVFPHESEREKVVVIFPGVAGEPAEFDDLMAIIEEIIPCHLEIEYRFLYPTWDQFEAMYPTFDAFDGTGFTWEQFETTLPPVEEE